MNNKIGQCSTSFTWCTFVVDLIPGGSQWVIGFSFKYISMFLRKIHFKLSFEKKPLRRLWATANKCVNASLTEEGGGVRL